MGIKDQFNAHPIENAQHIGIKDANLEPMPDAPQLGARRCRLKQ